MHVIGTAGHVDHGKSSLVQALTGIDPDRLAEEKRREMTIDLGFAWLELGGEEVGIIDVPGHRDFIENMLAGVGGIDLALFVIAADEGVMPQTREHLAILDLLSVQRGVIALTKTDLVPDREWFELVMLEIEDVLAGTVLQGAPIVPVSARTGDGLAALRETLAAELQRIPPRTDLGRPRLPIDRVFSIAGFGTIVTGTLIDGQLRNGDEVVVYPGSLRGRVRSIQTHKAKRDVALPGSRVAVNVGGIERGDVRRGQVLALPGAIRPTLLVDARYRHLIDSPVPLTHNMEVKFFSGAAEVVGHARVIGTEQLDPGADGWIQVALSEPVAVLRGDRFILRRQSPGTTLGGGVILDANPGRRHRRFRPEVLARFEKLAEGSPAELLMQTLQQQGLTTVQNLLARTPLDAEISRQALQELVDDHHALVIGKFVVTRRAWELLGDSAVTAVESYHRAAPLRVGMEREELRSRLQAPAAAFGPLVSELVAAGRLVEIGTQLRMPGHKVTFAPDDAMRIDILRQQLKAAGVNSPSVKECKSIVGEQVFLALVDLGELRLISEDVVYHNSDYTQLLDAITAELRAKKTIDAAAVRDLLGTSRKYAVALLEHLDGLHITRRVGDARELAPGATT